MHVGLRGALEMVCVLLVNDLTQAFCVFIMRLGALVACITLEFSASPRQFTQDCKSMGSCKWHRLLRPCSNYGQHPEGRAVGWKWTVLCQDTFINITDDLTLLTEVGSAS